MLLSPENAIITYLIKHAFVHDQRMRNEKSDELGIMNTREKRKWSKEIKEIRKERAKIASEIIEEKSVCRGKATKNEMCL